MIVDLATTSFPSQEFDLCIIGSGAAGTALAHQFDGGDFKILVCEAGGLDHEPATQSLYDSEVAGLPHVGIHEGRFRVHGGSTTRWGGQALPLLPSDFEHRDWVAHSGWPFRYETLEPFYRRASEFLLVDSRDFDQEVFRYLRREQAKLDPNIIWHHFSKWSPQPDLRHRYVMRFEQSRNITLLLHANVTQLTLAPNLAAVRSATVRSLTDQQAVVHAKRFVLCTGGIETARLLLSNRSQIPAGLGNEHDLVGRFFQDHPFVRVGRLLPANPHRFQRMFNLSVKNGLRYSTRLTATPALQREQKMLSVSALVLFELSQQSAVQRLKNGYAKLRFKRQPLAAMKDFLAAGLRLDQIAYPLFRYAAFGEVYTPIQQPPEVAMMCEQEPSPLSRVMLSEQCDALGIPRTRLDWNVTDLSFHTFRQYARALQAAFASSAIATFEPYAWLDDDAVDWRAQMVDQSHHIGTTRMSDLPTDGVVDANLKVHSLNNLYIAGSAVFPTGGHSNPTYTLLALTFRLADHLRSASN